MNITRYNYESYCIDYLDGKLTEKQIKELHTFLFLNDDLSEKIEGLELIKLKPDKLHYPHKSLLRKDELRACPDYYMIAEAENCLSPEDQQLPNQQIKYINLKNPYRSIKLIPDYKIHYPHRNKLYHKKKLFSLYLRIVATVLLILTLGVGLLYKKNITENQFNPIVDNKVIQQLFPESYELIQTHITPEIILQTIPSLQKSPKIASSVFIRTESPAPVQIIPLSQEALSHPSPEYTLNFTHSFINIHEIEINLTENAIAWKSSENSFLSDNIFTTMINAGKILAEKIKNKE